MDNERGNITAGYLSQLADDRNEARGDDDPDLVKSARMRVVR